MWLVRPAAAEPPQRWAGSEVSLRTSGRIASFGLENDWNPTLVQSLGLDPTWRLSPRWRVSGHAGLEVELTDSDLTSARRQPLLEDTTVAATWTLPTLPRGFEGVTGLRLALPSSQESRARRRLAAFSPLITLARPLSHGGLTFTPFLTLRGSWNWQLGTSAIYDGPSIVTCDPARGDACEEHDHAGVRGTRASAVQALGLNIDWPARALAFTAQVFWVESWLYALAPAQDPLGAPLAAGGPSWRFSNLYVLGAEWRPGASTRWKLGAGLSTENLQRRPDASLETPFLNRHTQLYLTVAATF
jgi:hypothetical protein